MNPGPPPFGFSWSKGRLVREPDQAETIVRMFELFVEKRNKAAVAKALDAEGRRTSRGSKWSDVAVLRTLSGEAAIGRHFTNTTKLGADGKREPRPRAEWVEILCEPVVNLPLWEKVQQFLEAQRSGIPVPRQSVSPARVFDGLLFCVCGSSMKSDADGKRYRCPKCGTGIGAADLNTIFEDELAYFLETRWEAFADTLAGNGDQAASRERLRDLIHRRSEREEERARIEDLYLKKRIDHERFGALDERAKQDILEIEVALREVERTLEKQEKRKRVNPPVGKQAVPGIEDIRKKWRKLGDDDRRTIVATLVNSLVLDGSRITFSYKFPAFVEDARANQQIANPTNRSKSASEPGEPIYIRLPKAGQRCQRTGLSRSALNDLIHPRERNGHCPQVESFRSKKGGGRLIVWASLKAFLASEGTSPGNSTAFTSEAKKT